MSLNKNWLDLTWHHVLYVSEGSNHVTATWKKDFFPLFVCLFIYLFILPSAFLVFFLLTFFVIRIFFHPHFPIRIRHPQVSGPRFTDTRFSRIVEIKNKVFASQSLYWSLLLTKGVVSKHPPSYPNSFDPQAWCTHPLLRQPLGQIYLLAKVVNIVYFMWTHNFFFL